jgi:hypothetical protein
VNFRIDALANSASPVNAFRQESAEIHRVTPLVFGPADELTSPCAPSCSSIR